MLLLEQRKEKLVSTPIKEVRPDQIKTACAPLAVKILEKLEANPTYAKDLARELREHEQKIYYHIRRLEKNGIIEVIRTEPVHGTEARIYNLTKPAYAIRFGKTNSQSVSRIGGEPQAFLEPFVENGELQSTIIVGSPDPHGPDMARSRDGYYGIDFALWLGTFLSTPSRLHVKLDTEVREEDLRGHVILLGGPVVNTVTRRINHRLPIRFDEKHHHAIHSTLSGKLYHGEEIGIIVKTKNPLNSKKSILVIAGKRHSGTRAAILALLTKLQEILIGNIHKRDCMAKIIEGIDKDSDGIVDSINIVE